ncbi:MAG: type II-A CRISPR-associated protein Csn2 [Candidatus Coprovivens sp.]
MNLKVEYFDNVIYLETNSVYTIEIENKKYFYRFVNDLFAIYNDGFTDDITFFEEEQEKNMNGKIKVFVDFFNFQFDSKKYINDVSKYVSENIDDEYKKDLTILYNKIIKVYKKILNEVELPLSVEDEVTVDTITKFVKVGINSKTELLDNLFLIIDLEKVLKSNNLLIFINLKQYLTRSELVELYKYAIYNNIQLLLVDSQSYGGTLEYEKKLIVDENLDEFMI